MFSVRYVDGWDAGWKHVWQVFKGECPFLPLSFATAAAAVSYMGMNYPTEAASLNYEV